MKNSLPVLVLALLLSLTPASLAQDRSVPDGVREMMRVHQKLSSIKETGEVRVIHVSLSGKAISWPNNYEHRTDGSRYFIKTFFPNKPDKLATYDNTWKIDGQFHYSWDGKRWLNFDDSTDLAKKVSVTQSPSPLRLDDNRVSPSAPMNGYLAGDYTTWMEKLRPGLAQWKRLPDEDTPEVAHLKLQIYEATIKDASYRFWVYPETFEIFNVTVTKTGNADYQGQPLSTPLPESFSDDPQQRIRTKVEFGIGGFQYKDTAAGRVPFAASWGTTITYASGKTEALIGDGERKKLEINPAFTDEDFIPTIPDGTPVELLDDPNNPIAQIWKDGKIVPQVDDAIFDEIEKPLASLDTHHAPAVIEATVEVTSAAPVTLAMEEHDSPASSRKLWLFIALALVLVLLLAVIVSRSRKRSASTSTPV